MNAYLRSNSFISNRTIVHLIPFFDFIYRKALDCVNSTQESANENNIEVRI